MVFRSTVPANLRTTGKPRTGEPMPIPSPSRGMNTLVNYIALPADQARYLVNWLPQSGVCSVRPGQSTSCTVSGAASMKSLMEYRGVNGTQLIGAGDDGKIYECTGITGSVLASGYVNNYWSYENSNLYLIAVNGEDTPFRFDGTSVTATGITGISDITELRTVKKCKGERLWFTVNNSAIAYYLDHDAIAGTLNAFDLSTIANGGWCMGVYPWKDFTVFVMSTGEVLIYAGDPTTTFSWQGSYRAPRPVAYDAAVKIGGDLVLMTVAGPITLELIAAGLAFDVDSLQGWGWISPTWSADVNLYEGNSGWNAIYHNGIVIFNIPTDIVTSKQYVNNLNVPGGAWTTYDAINAGEFAQTENGIYFSDKAAGRICTHSGNDDDGEYIEMISRQGFTYPTNGKSRLQYTAARLNYNTDGESLSSLAIDVDHIESNFGTQETYLSLEGGSGDWGDDWGADWGIPAEAQLRWQKVKGIGRCVAPAVKIKTKASTFDWFATDVIAIPTSG